MKENGPAARAPVVLNEDGSPRKTAVEASAERAGRR
jgi:hypothetical protein